MSTSVAIDVYQVVTDRIISLLHEGTIPWHQPWISSGPPRNLLSKRPYKGINVWLLGSLKYEQSLWLTFEQLKQIGGSVLKGEHGEVVVFWKTQKKGEGAEGTEGEKVKKSRSILRYYKVFNIVQCKDIPERFIPKIEAYDHDPILECEAILHQVPNCPDIRHHEQEAYYHAEEDFINMPKKKSFKAPEDYYATLFHELIHATGHTSRLNRKTLTEMAEFGSDTYSKEELVAEIGSCFLSNFAGILPQRPVHNVAYIAGWLAKLHDDKRLIVHAAAQAQRAADYLLNIKEEVPNSETETDNVQE
jgi:antirestriction protein ArdC